MPFFQLILSTRKSDFRAFDPLLALFGGVHSEWVTVENESDCKRPKSSAAVREVNIIIIRILQKKYILYGRYTIVIPNTKGHFHTSISISSLIK